MHNTPAGGSRSPEEGEGESGEGEAGEEGEGGASDVAQARGHVEEAGAGRDGEQARVGGVGAAQQEQQQQQPMARRLQASSVLSRFFEAVRNRHGVVRGREEGDDAVLAAAAAAGAEG